MTLVPPSQGMWLHGVWEAKEAEAVCCLYFKRPNCASPDPAQVILPIFTLLLWGLTMKGVGTPHVFLVEILSGAAAKNSFTALLHAKPTVITGPKSHLSLHPGVLKVCKNHIKACSENRIHTSQQGRATHIPALCVW